MKNLTLDELLARCTALPWANDYPIASAPELRTKSNRQLAVHAANTLPELVKAVEDYCAANQPDGDEYFDRMTTALAKAKTVKV